MVPGNQKEKRMIRRQFGVAAVAVFMILASCALFAFASSVRFTISHNFMVDGKEYPAGSYDISLQGNSESRLTLRNLKTNQTFSVNVITRLAQSEDNQSSVTFDRIEDTYYLSEVHIMGVDGFHLQGAPGPYQHASFRASK
jgi:hypothetical protein